MKLYTVLCVHSWPRCRPSCDCLEWRWWWLIYSINIFILYIYKYFVPHSHPFGLLCLTRQTQCLCETHHSCLFSNLVTLKPPHWSASMQSQPSNPSSKVRSGGGGGVCLCYGRTACRLYFFGHFSLARLPRHIYTLNMNTLKMYRIDGSVFFSFGPSSTGSLLRRHRSRHTLLGYFYLPFSFHLIKMNSRVYLQM